MTYRLKQILPALFVICCVLFLTHFFIFKVAVRSFENSTELRNILAFALILGALSMPSGFILSMTSLNQKFKWLTWVGYIWMGFFQILFFSSIVEFSLSFFVPHEFSYWVVIFSFLISVYALQNGLRTPRVIHHKIQGPDFMRGLTLVQVSDLHVGLLHQNERWLTQVVDLINQCHPDFIAITGDLVEGSFKNISPQLQVLEKLQQKKARFYITGNHEYIHGSGPWEERLEELSFEVLHNTHRIYPMQNAQLMIAGVPDRMVKRFQPSLYSNPDQALKASSPVDYKILLAHEPASVWDLKNETCDLILSGHTHGGQIFPFGFFVRLVQPLIKGFKKFGPVLVFAHQGTGLWGPPMRWFTRNEIVKLTWTV